MCFLLLMFGSQLQQGSKPIMQEDKKKKGISSTKPESAVESRSFNRTESSPAESWSNEDPVPSSGELNISSVISGQLANPIS